MLSFTRTGLAWLAALAFLPAQAALPRYDIHVAVKPDALSVDTTLTLPAEAAPRKSLQFELLPTMGTPKVELIAPKSAGTLTLHKLKDDSDALKPRTVWEIAPASAFPAGEPVTLRITHSGGGGGLLVHYVGPEFVIASGIVQPWLPQFSDVKMLGSLHLDIPSGFLALASGERVSERVNGSRRHIEFHMTEPTRFNFVAGPLKVHKAPGKAGEIPVSLYLLSDRDFEPDLVGLVRSAIAILEKEFGPYPYKEFAVVEFPTGPGLKASFGGASQDGYMLMRTDDLDHKRADASFFGHEIGHQWWGVAVSYPGGDGGDFMLDEALAEYGAIKVIEGARGPEAAKAFRRDTRDKVIRRIGAGYDGPLFDIPEPGPSDSTFFYQDVVRSKGALVYDVVARSIGAEPMRGFFRDIMSTYAYSSRLTWHDFVARWKKAAGPEHEGLIDQWLDQKGLPVLDFQWTAKDGAVAVAIGQHAQGMPLYRLAVPVRLVYADGSTEQRQVEVAAQPQTGAVLPASKPVSRAELDPERIMPWVTPEELATSVALKIFTLSWQLWDEGKTDEAENILKADLAARAAPDASAAEFLERYHYGWLLEDKKKLPEALDQYMRALQLPVRPSGNESRHLIQLYANIARVATAMGDKPKARWAAKAALAAIEAAEQDGYTKRMRAEVGKYLE